MGRQRSLLLTLLVAGIVAGCSSMTDPGSSVKDPGPRTEPPGPTTDLPATPFLVSGPLRAPVAGSTVLRSTGTSTVAYVSLLPGTLLDATSATITNARSGTSVRVPIVEGGFDPVALDASLGDTLVVAVRNAGGHGGNYRVLVKARPPVVVRTVPRGNKRDVPLNVRITVVFSQPINPATLTASTVLLTQAGTVVSGQLRLVDSAGTVIEFLPADPLKAATDYSLEVSDGIRSLDGHPLAAGVEVPFTTAGAGAPATEQWPWFVSRPVPYASGTWAFVSAPPGALPSQTWVSINAGGGGAVKKDAPWTGALDPAPVAAHSGDTLHITVNLTSGALVKEYFAVVPASSVPVVVRSAPVRNDTGFRIDLDLLLVFSEPIVLGVQEDIATSAMRLETSGASVPGTWGAGGWVPPEAGGVISIPAPYRVIFSPAAMLTPGTSYDLVLTSGVVGDQGGSPMVPDRIHFTTLNPPPGPLDAVLSVKSFSMIEYQYPGDTLYYYAPRLQLAETGGRSTATVVRLGFTLSEYPPLSDMCSPGELVAPGQTADMFGVSYGDYELSYFTLDGKRAGAGRATVTITYYDDAGRTGTLTADGAVIPGGLPEVYMAGQPHRYFNGSIGCQNPWFLRSGKGGTAASVRFAKK